MIKGYRLNMIAFWLVMLISMHSNDGNFYVKKLIGKCKSNILIYKGTYSGAIQSLHVIGGENNVAYL